MTKRPTRPKPHAISDTNAAKITTVATMVRNSATSLGNRACNRACSGHITAMINIAKASGANTVLVK
jgi:hypothetical protein